MKPKPEVASSKIKSIFVPLAGCFICGNPFQNAIASSARSHSLKHSSYRFKQNHPVKSLAGWQFKHTGITLNQFA
ncbi:MAG: hypothetical protein KME13_08025 [Myxacorys californica WJT36-NPBG1]|nr:hypothetical protein [Myxacorys californica WJT36-NPBG1]